MPSSLVGLNYHCSCYNKLLPLNFYQLFSMKKITKSSYIEIKENTSQIKIMVHIENYTHQCGIFYMYAMVLCQYINESMRDIVFLQIQIIRPCFKK